MSLSNRVREKWGPTKLDNFKPMGMQNWLMALEDAPKTKGHLKAFINRLFNKAEPYEMLEFIYNPIKLVEVRGISKRRRKPADLAIEQFSMIFLLLPEPYNVMALVEQCTGLRVSEMLALRWSVIDFERLRMTVKEGVVNGRIGPLKTECSR